MARVKPDNPFAVIHDAASPEHVPLSGSAPAPSQFHSTQSNSESRPLKPYRLNLDITPDLRDKLIHRAKQRGLSAAALVRSLIEAEVESI